MARSAFRLSRRDAIALKTIVSEGSRSTAELRRAQLILMLASDHLHCTDAFIARWKHRFQRSGIAAVVGPNVRQPVRHLSPEVVAAIVAWAIRSRLDPDSMSIREISGALRVSHATVARLRQRFTKEARLLKTADAPAPLSPDMRRSGANPQGDPQNRTSFRALFGSIDEASFLSGC
jgi:hypothetical protein